MATLTVRDLPDDVRDKLRVRAAENGRSMEAEVRAVLRASIEAPPTTRQRVERLQAAFAPYRAVSGSVVDELISERREEDRREDGCNAVSDRQSPARKTQAEKLAEARAIIRRRVPADRSLVDEFLAERREMWGEE